MSDIALRWDVATGDVAIEGDDLARDDGLETAVIVSLFTDRRAEESDALPDGQTDRRGWWGDDRPQVPGDHIGSRLWLLGREKQQVSVLSRADGYVREALAWLLTDQIAAAVDVTVEFTRPGVLGIAVTIQRPQADPVDFRFTYLWLAQEARA